MWTTLRNTYENQKRIKARIYQRPEQRRKDDQADEQHGIIIALLQEAVKKYPQKSVDLLIVMIFILYCCMLYAIFISLLCW